MLSGDRAGCGDEWEDVIPGEGEIELGDLSSVRYDAREQLLSPEIQEEASLQYGEWMLKKAMIFKLLLIDWLVLSSAKM